jgi:hypothetical protein
MKMRHASVAPERRSKSRAHFVASPSDQTLPPSNSKQVANAVLWSVLGRSIRDTLWFRLVPVGVISAAQNNFRYHHREGLEALLKPVSQVRILPGAQTMPGAQVRRGI